MEFRVHGVPFDSCIVGGELPVDAFGVIVSPGRPSGDLLANFVDASNTSAQALFRQHTQFTFRKVQPTAMPRSINKLATPQYFTTVRWREPRVKRTLRVRVQVVQNDRHFFRVCKTVPDQSLDFLRVFRAFVVNNGERCQAERNAGENRIVDILA